jgi:hypothetical protein
MRRWSRQKMIRRIVPVDFVPSGGLPVSFFFNQEFKLKSLLPVTLQSRVAKGHGLGLRERQRGAPAWGPGRFVRNHEAVISPRRGGGQGLPPLFAEAKLPARAIACPGRCFLREPPEPPGRNKVGFGPPVTEGLPFLPVDSLENVTEGIV